MDECLPLLKLFNVEHVYSPEDCTRFFLEEKRAGGEGKTFFASARPCIVIKAGSTGPLLWSLKNGKISEGAILTQDESGYHLHILEMKSKLTQGEWAKVMLQFEGMHLTSMAVTRLLGVTEIKTVTCYITFKQNAMDASKSADMILMKTFVGMPNIIGSGDAWESETIELPLTGIAGIKKASRDSDNNADFGFIN